MKIDIEKNIVRVAKILAKEYKSNPTEDDGRVGITDHFSEVYHMKEKKSVLNFKSYDRKNGKWVEIPFGDIDIYSESFGSISKRIVDKLVGLLKVKPSKCSVVYDTVNQRKGSWWSSYEYTIYRSVTFVPVCKEFLKVNKRLGELGMPLIDVKKWTHGELAGKRASVFSKGYHYYASSKKQCDKVLEYLKGKKKLNKVEVVERVYDEERQYGIEHETEWYGSYNNFLRFTDAKNKVSEIW